MRKEGIVWKTFKVLVILLGMVLILGPIFVIFINSMKTMQEAGRNFFACRQDLILTIIRNCSAGVISGAASVIQLLLR